MYVVLFHMQLAAAIGCDATVLVAPTIMNDSHVTDAVASSSHLDPYSTQRLGGYNRYSTSSGGGGGIVLLELYGLQPAKIHM
jgi:hypothetical protein